MPRPKNTLSLGQRAQAEAWADYFREQSREIPSCEPAFFAGYDHDVVPFNDLVSSGQNVEFIDAQLKLEQNNMEWIGDSLRFRTAVQSLCVSELTSPDVVVAAIGTLKTGFESRHLEETVKSVNAKLRYGSVPIDTSKADVSVSADRQETSDNERNCVAVVSTRPGNDETINNDADYSAKKSRRDAIPIKALQALKKPLSLLSPAVRDARWGDVYVLLFSSFVAAQPLQTRGGNGIARQLPELLKKLQGWYPCGTAYELDPILSHLKEKRFFVTGYDNGPIFPSSIRLATLLKYGVAQGENTHAFSAVFRMALQSAYALLDGALAKKIAHDIDSNSRLLTDHPFYETQWQVLCWLAQRHERTKSGDDQYVKIFGSSRFARSVRGFSRQIAEFAKRPAGDFKTRPTKDVKKRPTNGVNHRQWAERYAF